MRAFRRASSANIASTATRMPDNERVLIVTGASSGIGAALARAAARRRLSRRDRRAPRRAARRSRAMRFATPAVQVVSVAGDVTAGDMPARIVATTLSSFGRIDAVVNNAGGGALGALLEQTDAAIEAQWRLHVVAPLKLSRAALPHLEATRGQLVFLGSGIARVPLPNYGAYALAKAADSSCGNSVATRVARPRSCRHLRRSRTRRHRVSRSYGNRTRGRSSRGLARARRARDLARHRPPLRGGQRRAVADRRRRTRRMVRNARRSIHYFAPLPAKGADASPAILRPPSPAQPALSSSKGRRTTMCSDFFRGGARAGGAAHGARQTAGAVLARRARARRDASSSMRWRCDGRECRIRTSARRCERRSTHLRPAGYLEPLADETWKVTRGADA